jgi:hypothetical protein
MTGFINAKGVVHGKTIELDEQPGIPEGQRVSVLLRPALAAGEGLRRAFGAWAEDAEHLRQFLDGIYRDRSDDRLEPLA